MHTAQLHTSEAVEYDRSRNDSGDIHRIGRVLFLVVCTSSFFKNLDNPKSAIFGMFDSDNNTLRAAMSLWTILFLCRCSTPSATPLIIFILCVGSNGSELYTNLSKLPSGQYSKILRSYYLTTRQSHLHGRTRAVNAYT